MEEVKVDEEWLKFRSEKVKKIILKYGGDLFTDLDKEYLRKELKDNYNDILIRIQSKLKEAGLSTNIGIAPLLMDFDVSEDMNLGYHHKFQVELILESTGERYSESSFVMSPLDFEKFAYRLIDLNKN